MQLNVHPIAYSGISEDLLTDFLTTTSLPLFCSEPSFLEINNSSMFYTGGHPSEYGAKQFVVIDGEEFNIGLYNYPWTLRVKIKDINTDFNFKHWGQPLSTYLNFAGTTRIVDYTVRTFGDRSFLLCLNNGLPLVIVFDKTTSLLTYNVQRFYLYSTAVDHVQWITMPDGSERILIRKGDNIYFIYIADSTGSYPIIGTPIAVTGVLNRGLNHQTYATSWSHSMYYYHGDILCYYSTAYNSNTVFYHWDSAVGRFLLDLTLPIASYYMYYSYYNNAINILYEDSTFIGDYRWYLVTPASDLYSFFYSSGVSEVFNHENAPIGSNSRAMLVSMYQDVQYVYVVFVDYYPNDRLRLAYVKFEQPSVTTALFNVNNGIPFSAITGYLSIEGDLYYPDFKWEVASKNSFTVYTGLPELLITEPSIVNLRLTPSMPQSISILNYVPLENSSILYERVDDRIINFTILYSLFKDYKKVDISLYNLPISPFMLLSIGNINIRHCYSNTGSFCLASREEFKTVNCNINCPEYLKKNLIKEIELNGSDITGVITDERENFPNFQENAVIDVRLFN
jgi:hypothetical protein